MSPSTEAPDPEPGDMDHGEAPHGGPLFATGWQKRTDVVLATADNHSRWHRELVQARARTSAGRKTRVVKAERLKIEKASAIKKSAGRKAVGYKVVLEGAGMLSPQVYANIKHIAETATPAQVHFLIELTKSLHTRHEQDKVVAKALQKIAFAQINARAELDAASAVATANDALTAQQECDGFANHDATDPDALL